MSDNTIINTNNHYLLDFLDFSINQGKISNAQELLDIYKLFISKKVVNDVPEMQCAYIYKRGSKKNKANSQCSIHIKNDSGFCSKHKKYKKQIIELDVDVDIHCLTEEEVDIEHDDIDTEETPDWSPEVFSDEEF